MVKICLDAGHYGKYNQSPVVKTYYESGMAWTLHQKLKQHLESYGIEVTVTRTDKDKDLAVYTRGQMAKGCDLFISLHSNACDTESVDYPLAIVPINGSADKIGKQLASCIQQTMGTKQAGKTMTKKSTTGSTDYYGVIRGAVSVGVPGIILEHSFHTNTRAATWLSQDANLDKLAQAEAETIAGFYGLQKARAGSGTVYAVQVGAFAKKSNAEAMLAKVKKAGFDACIVAK